MSKLEQMKEQKFYQYLQVAGFHKEAEQFVTEVWNETIKECVEIAKEEERHAVGLLALVPQTIVRRLEALPRANTTSDK